MKYRPQSTVHDTKGHWALYYEVADLSEIEPSQRLKISTFFAYGKPRPYGRTFVPEGPLLVEHP